MRRANEALFLKVPLELANARNIEARKYGDESECYAKAYHWKDHGGIIAWTFAAWQTPSRIV